jgi:glycosyltransferase involved in cell wall biosynthesis
MKKILFVVNAEKISPNANGGAAVLYSHLELLHTIGYEVILLAVEWNKSYHFRESDYQEVESFVSEILRIQIDPGKKSGKLKRVVQAIFNPVAFEYSFVNPKNIRSLQNIVKQKTIDLVWCEWRWSAIWALETPLKIPKIYAHHDWEYKLALLRKKPTLKKRFHTIQKKRVEMKLVKEMTACISGSRTETKEIEQISKQNALYLPTTYHSVSSKLTPKKHPSIVHLGGMGTTANRLGLERFIDVCWSDIKKTIPNIQLLVIGSIKRAQPSLQEKLKDQNIKTLGFVKDLDSVLYPNDIHIIPWEHNTGTRTRIPVILNYRQTLVATKASVQCYPEITKENSVLCNDLDEMKEAIIHLYSDAEKLHLLADNGNQTFKDNFTLESQKNKLKQFLKDIF